MWTLRLLSWLILDPCGLRVIINDINKNLFSIKWLIDKLVYLLINQLWMLLNNFEPETKSHDRIDVQRELTFSPLSMECHSYTKIAPTGVIFFLILKLL